MTSHIVTLLMGVLFSFGTFLVYRVRVNRCFLVIHLLLIVVMWLADCPWWLLFLTAIFYPASYCQLMSIRQEVEGGNRS